jgi:hypothetical protein
LSTGIAIFFNCKPRATDTAETPGPFHTNFTAKVA